MPYILILGGGVVALLAYLFRLRPGTVTIEDAGGGFVEDSTVQKEQPRSDLPKGIRNNNPTNLRYVPTIVWIGQKGGDSGGYAIFDNAANGLRAGFINLHTGFNNYGTDTVRKIITRWAPHNENPTDAYVSYVAKTVGVSPDQRVSYSQYARALIRAITQFENGVTVEWFPTSVYDQAYAAAGRA